ncbi:MAG: hypothetical protein LBB61_09290 [Treponema sp.]|jgi:hypothetical protein|nr:hypothetical protein [Treponema sp.]
MAHFDLYMPVSWADGKKCAGRLERDMKDGVYDAGREWEYFNGSVSFTSWWNTGGDNPS